MPQGNLHEYAVQANANLEKLATGLAQAGTDDQTIKVVSQMADVTRKIVSALGKGQERTGDNQPAPPVDPAAPTQEQTPNSQPPGPGDQQDQPLPGDPRDPYGPATAALHKQTQAQAR